MSVFQKRIDNFTQHLESLKANDRYYYLQRIDELDGAHVWIGGRRMVMFSSYSYLGLLKDEKVQRKAREALDRFGTGTTACGCWQEPQQPTRRREDRKLPGTEDAIAYSSGYVANLSTISTLRQGRRIIVDQLSHASIIDLLAVAPTFQRFTQRLDDLRRLLENASESTRQAGIVDASTPWMETCALPELVALCREFDAWLVVDEAHPWACWARPATASSEYFNMSPDDGTAHRPSKTIPAVGGFVAGKRDVIQFLRHNARAVFGAPAAGGCGGGPASLRSLRRSRGASRQ